MEKDVEKGLRAEGYELLAGVDEAGRGAMAGPLVAAAVILPPKAHIPGLRDSKVLNSAQREKAWGHIVEQALDWSWSFISPEEVDSWGLQAANLRALREAVEGLSIVPDLVVVDWFEIPGLSLPQRGFTHGDALLPSISAASILAKVTRDRIMRHLSSLYPGYGFSDHKGYCTDQHKKALRAAGPCLLHRKSYRPVSQMSLEI